MASREPEPLEDLHCVLVSRTVHGEIPTCSGLVELEPV